MAKMQELTHKQTTINKRIFKHATLLLLSKNRNRDAMAFRSRKNLDDIAKHSSKNHIVITQKQIKKEKSTHKLHSPHPFI